MFVKFVTPKFCDSEGILISIRLWLAQLSKEAPLPRERVLFL